MKRNNTVLFALMIVLLIGSRGYTAEFAPVGTAVAQFLEIGVGAQAAGMGEAFTVVANDASAVFWNPACLVDAGNRNLFSAYNQWPADIAFAGLAYSMKLGRIGTVAVSGVYLMTDDMEVTTIEQSEGTGEMFSLINYALGLSYARFLTDRVSVGLTAKMVSEDYFGYGYDTWAIDLGTVYRTSFHGLKLGMSIMHFAPEVQFSGTYYDYSESDSIKEKKFETYSLPMNFRFGVSMNLLETTNHKILLAADLIHTNNNLEQYNLGLEYSFMKMFCLRSGYKMTTDEGGLTFGAGVKIRMGELGLNADYAYSDLGILKGAHRVSLGIAF
jgi:hypothetical protein